MPSGAARRSSRVRPEDWRLRLMWRRAICSGVGRADPASGANRRIPAARLPVRSSTAGIARPTSSTMGAARCMKPWTMGMARSNAALAAGTMAGTAAPSAPPMAAPVTAICPRLRPSPAAYPPTPPAVAPATPERSMALPRVGAAATARPATPAGTAACVARPTPRVRAAARGAAVSNRCTAPLEACRACCQACGSDPARPCTRLDTACSPSAASSMNGRALRLKVASAPVMVSMVLADFPPAPGNCRRTSARTCASVAPAGPWMV